MWSTPQRIHSITIDTSATTATCHPAGRNLAGADVQWWNGSAWVTASVIRGQTNDWSYTFPTPITTTRLRLFNAHTSSVGQGSNPLIFEWYVYGCR